MRTVGSVCEYIEVVQADCAAWQLPFGCAPWFRGQSDSAKPPLPGILRGEAGGRTAGIGERAMIERFRALAPMFGPVPPRDHKDEWLYFMQHVGMPTRLLDWTEGAIIGLYFAVQNCRDDHDPGVWMLHPLEMNCRTIGAAIFPAADHPAFVNRCDFAYGAFRGAPMDIKWPIAIVPTHVHPRMRAQKGCFTLHGAGRGDFQAMALESGLAEAGFFVEYRIARQRAPAILRDLRLLGTTHCSLFADHDGLAIEMKRLFATEAWAQTCPNAETPWG